MYTTTLTFNKRKFEIGIKTIFDTFDEENHYDLEIKTNKRLSGNEFLALRKYLEEEGYIEEAKKFNEEYYS